MAGLEGRPKEKSPQLALHPLNFARAPEEDARPVRVHRGHRGNDVHVAAWAAGRRIWNEDARIHERVFQDHLDPIEIDTLLAGALHDETMFRGMQLDPVLLGAVAERESVAMQVDTMHGIH